jgi:hypothetical protein
LVAAAAAAERAVLQLVVRAPLALHLRGRAGGRRARADARANARRAG